MLVNIKVTGGLNIEWGQIDPKVTGGLRVTIRFIVFIRTCAACNNRCRLSPLCKLLFEIKFTLSNCWKAQLLLSRAQLHFVGRSQHYSFFPSESLHSTTLYL